MKNLIQPDRRPQGYGGRLLALAAGAGFLGSASASTVYDSEGFESPVFLLEQELDTQDPGAPIGNGPWAKDDGTSTAVVTAVNAVDGTKSVKITRNPGATGDTRWGVVKPSVPGGTDNVVAVNFDMRVVQRTNDFGPLFGAEAYDYAYGQPVMIGGVFHDSSNGELVVRQADTGELIGTGIFPDLAVHHHYRLLLNFTAKTYSVEIDGVSVHTEGFVSSQAASFYDGPIATLSGGGPDDTGTAYIDNYSVERTTSLLPHLVWNGDGTTSVWHNGPAASWFDGIGPAPFANGEEVRFTDAGSPSEAVDIQGSVLPESILVSSDRDYGFGGSGSIDGATGLVKQGTGILTLSNANGYTGDTTVLDGGLRVTNEADSATGSGALSVSSRCTLSGDGTVGGPANIAAGAVVDPGDGVGTLGFGSDLVLADSTLRMQLGSQSDRIDVAGDLTVSGVVEIEAGGGYGPGTYPLISYGGDLNAGTLTISGAPENYIYDFSTETPGVLALVVAPLPPKPAKPSALAAAPLGKNEVVLTWTDQSDNEDKFVIERSEDGVSFQVVGASDADATSFFDGGLSSGTSYSYRILASNRGGKSGYSNVATARTNVAPPVARLAFDETGGTTAFDSSPNGNDGTLVGDPAFAAGQFDGALDLDGTDDHAVLPAGIVSNLSDFTISTWVNLDSVDGWSRIFDFGSDTSTYMFLTPSNGATGKLRFAISTGGGSGEQKLEGPSALPTGEWTHVAVTLSGTEGTLYVNGSAVAINNAMNLNPSGLGATTNNYLGRSQYPDPYLNGRLDEFQIHERALSAAEIAALADTATPRPPTGLVAVEESGKVRLSWNAVDGAESYTVYRLDEAGGYRILAENLVNPSFTDHNLTNGTTYTYLVTASNASGESVFSTLLEATPQIRADYSGRAYVLGFSALGFDTVWQDSGELPEDGGSLENSFQTVDEPGVIYGEVGHSFVIGQAARTRSEASVSEIEINAGGVLVEVGFAMARSLAVAQSDGTTDVAGGAEIAELVIAGITTAVTGQANQTIELPLGLGHLIVNEQITTDTSITVNALHLILSSGEDFIVASARAGVESTEPPPIEGDDRISGGGWIPGPNKKRNFGFSSGLEDGVLTGHLTYKDKDTGLKVKGTSITSYAQGSTATTRVFQGTAEINGTGGHTFTIEAADNGEPGDADTFSISLSNGYHAEGALGGGNIQLHVPGE